MMMMSLLCLPPDPTLTVENVNRVIAKVEPKERMKLYEEGSVAEKIQAQYSTESEREVAFIDAYVNCEPSSSWHKLAGVLYRLHHVAAVEDVRPYLPPRGESGCYDVCTVLLPCLL